MVCDNRGNCRCWFVLSFAGWFLAFCSWVISTGINTTSSVVVRVETLDGVVCRLSFCVNLSIHILWRVFSGFMCLVVGVIHMLGYRVVCGVVVGLVNHMFWVWVGVGENVPCVFAVWRFKHHVNLEVLWWLGRIFLRFFGGWRVGLGRLTNCLNGLKRGESWATAYGSPALWWVGVVF